jgi:transposase
VYNFIGPDQGPLAGPVAKLAALIPEDHLMWRVSDLVDDYDLEVFERAYRSDGVGGKPHDPGQILKIIVYCELLQIRSPSAIARACQEQICLHVLLGGHRPSREVFRRFIKTHKDSYHDVFVWVLSLCHDEGLVDLSITATDGTPMLAPASLSASYSIPELQERIEQIDAQITELHAKSASAVEHLDTESGLDAYIEEHCTVIPAQINRLNRKRLRMQKALDGAMEREFPATSDRATASQKIEKLRAKVEHHQRKLDEEIAAHRRSTERYQRKVAERMALGWPEALAHSYAGFAPVSADQHQGIAYRRALLATAERALWAALREHGP